MANSPDVACSARETTNAITIQPPSGLWPTCGTAWRENNLRAKRMQAAGPARKLAKRAWVLPAKPQRIRKITS